MCRRSNKYAAQRFHIVYIYTTGFQRLFAWRPRFKTRQSRASVAQDRWVMVERFELLPRVDVCMNHWPIFIAIFTGSRLSADYLSENRWKTVNYSNCNCCESLFFYRFIDMWMAIGSFFHSSRCKPYWNNFWFL